MSEESHVGLRRRLRRTNVHVVRGGAQPVQATLVTVARRLGDLLTSGRTYRNLSEPGFDAARPVHAQVVVSDGVALASATVARLDLSCDWRGRGPLVGWAYAWSRAPAKPARARLHVILTTADDAHDGTAVLCFTHSPVGEAILNTVFSSSRLLIPGHPPGNSEHLMSVEESRQCAPPPKTSRCALRSLRTGAPLRRPPDRRCGLSLTRRCHRI